MNCNRRTLLKTAATLIVLPAAGAAKAVSVCPATDITIPPEKDLISSFGWVTDVHYSVQPVRRIDNEDSTRVLRAFPREAPPGNGSLQYP